MSTQYTLIYAISIKRRTSWPRKDTSCLQIYPRRYEPPTKIWSIPNLSPTMQLMMINDSLLSDASSSPSNKQHHNCWTSQSANWGESLPLLWKPWMVLSQFFLKWGIFATYGNLGCFFPPSFLSQVGTLPYKVVVTPLEVEVEEHSLLWRLLSSLLQVFRTQPGPFQTQCGGQQYDWTMS